MSAGIPKAIRAGLDRYVMHGIRPGDCLFAILCGDLYAAFSRADAETTAAMPAIVAEIRMRVDTSIWGSPAKVERYIANSSARLMESKR